MLGKAWNKALLCVPLCPLWITAFRRFGVSPFLLYVLCVICGWSSPSVFAQSDLQRQVDACAQLTTCNLTVPAGITVLTKPWNLRDKTWLTIRGTGTAIWYFDSDPAPAVCLDTTGSMNIAIEGVTFALGNASKRPEVLWLHGRGANQRSQSRLSVIDADFLGWFNRATVAFIAVENELVISSDFTNGVPNTPALFLSRGNEIGASSPFGPVRVNIAAMTSTNHGYINCAFGHEGDVNLVSPATNDLGFGLTLGTGVYDLLVQGGSTTGGPRGGVMRIMGNNNRRINIVSPNWEAKGALAAVVIDGEVVGLKVDGGLLMSSGPAIQINGTIDGLTLAPAEMLCNSIIRFGAGGRMVGAGMTAPGVSGQ